MVLNEMASGNQMASEDKMAAEISFTYENLTQFEYLLQKKFRLFITIGVIWLVFKTSSNNDWLVNNLINLPT